MRDLYYIGKGIPEDQVRALVKFTDDVYMAAIELPENAAYVVDIRGEWLMAEPIPEWPDTWPVPERVKRLEMLPGQYVCSVYLPVNHLNRLDMLTGARAVTYVGRNRYLLHRDRPVYWAVSYKVEEVREFTLV